MSDNNENTQQALELNPEDPAVKALIEAQVAERLKQVKGSLDGAYAQRDALQAKLDELAKKEREAEIAALEAQGKIKEAYEARLAELNTKAAALEQTNTQLTRDVTVREALKGFTFRNTQAADFAFRELTSNLVKDSTGTWVHRSGKPVAEYVAEFSADEAHSFLFKPKASAGSGQEPPAGKTPPLTRSKSLFEMSQAEVLALAESGQL